MVGIYKITNPSGRVYIGQSCRIEHRKDQYRRLECKNQIRVYASISKYGWEAHKFEIIHELPQEVAQETLNTYEVLYWEQYRDCKVRMLNIKDPGSDGRNSQETIDKIAKALKGNKNASGSRSEEFKEKCKLNRIGKPSNMLNRKHTKETLDKISKANKGKSAINRKAVINMETGVVYKSLTEAANLNNIFVSQLSARLNNKLKNKTNLRWHKLN